MASRNPKDDLVVAPDDDELDIKMSKADIELLRASLIEHGKRLGALEARLESQMDDLVAVRSIIRQTNDRMQKLIDKLRSASNNN